LREIQLALGQLSIQGLALRPEAIYVWSPEGDAGSAGSLEKGLGLTARVTPRPEPVLPQPHSKLLPADVRAARRVQVARQQRTAAIAAVLVAYLGVAGWFGYQVWRDKQKIKKLRADAEEIISTDMSNSMALHEQEWKELEPVVDINRSPVDIMFRINKVIPPNSQLRLTKAEINEDEISLQGEAPQSGPIGTFSASLAKPSTNLTQYKWNNPPAATDPKKGWKFNFSGVIPKS
jgi:hypothetical protein